MNKYRVVFQLNTADAGVHKATIGQIRNILKSEEDIAIELVTHGGGADLLLSGSSLETSLSELLEKGVRFLVCGNTLASRKLGPDDFIEGVSIVSSAVVHLIKRQQEGWAYLKAG